MYLFYIPFYSIYSLKGETTLITFPCTQSKVTFTDEDDGNKCRSLLEMITVVPSWQKIRQYNDKSVYFTFYFKNYILAYILILTFVGGSHNH